MTDTQTKFLNLGEITVALAVLPETMPAFVMMGGELLSPDGVDSYRGYRTHLAIEPVSMACQRTVGDLLTVLLDAEGRVYPGFNGGEYLVNRETRVCVSRYTADSQDYVTGVEVRDGAAVVVTEKVS